VLHHGQRGKLFSRRAAMLAGVKLGLFTVLAGRLYYLQVIEADRYAVLSERNRVSVRLITPPGG
jgi:penicillin-binding protein 2